MQPFGSFSPTLVAELEKLMRKLSQKESSFTSREHQLMEILRQSRDVILPQLEAARQLDRGTNTAGDEKLTNLIRSIEKICEVN